MAAMPLPRGNGSTSENRGPVFRKSHFSSASRLKINPQRELEPMHFSDRNVFKQNTGPRFSVVGATQRTSKGF